MRSVLFTGRNLRRGGTLGFLARRTLAALVVAALVVLVLAAPSGAAVTIGADLSTPATETSSCGPANGDPFGCTRFNSVVPGRTITSPITGVVVRWRLHPEAGSVAQNVRLRIIRPAGGGPTGAAGPARPTPSRPPRRCRSSRPGCRFSPVTTSGSTKATGATLDASIRRARSGCDIPEASTPGWRIQGPSRPSLARPEPTELVLNADIEADADGDKFGDESQDQCPTDASTQGPCPPVHASMW